MEAMFYSTNMLKGSLGIESHADSYMGKVRLEGGLTYDIYITLLV